jgi:hypothetical protein
MEIKDEKEEPSSKKIRLSCLICQKSKREQLIRSSKTKDQLLSSSLKHCDLNYEVWVQLSELVYHQTCYKRYILNAKRLEDVASTEKVDTQQKSANISFFSNKNCIFCNRLRCKEGRKLKLMRNKKNARFLMIASHHLQDSVFAKTGSIRTSAKLIESELKYHEYCMKMYFKTYRRSKTKKEIAQNNETENVGDDIMASNNNKQYSLSDRIVRKKSKIDNPINQQVKKKLDKIHPDIDSSRKNESKIVSSASASSVTEPFSENKLSEAAFVLRRECEDYDYGLDGKFCDEDDLTNAERKYSEARPMNWSYFFEQLIPAYKHSDFVKRKCDMAFEIIYNIIHGRKKTPLMIANAQLIHETSRSRG